MNQHLSPTLQTRDAYLLETLKSQLGWIEHWRRDVECGCKPTAGSLNAAAFEVRAAIKMMEVTTASGRALYPEEAA